MANNKPQSLGVVIFFERDGEVYKRIGQTPPLRYPVALDVYANTPNPASQLVGGETAEEINVEVTKMVENMSNKEYVEEYVDPYI